MQSRSPLQALNWDHSPLLQTRVWMPQTPHDWTKGPSQVWPVQPPHWHDERQVRVPPVPQASDVFGSQTPPSMHSEKGVHLPFTQFRVRSPQSPQASVPTWPLVHSMGRHVSQAQLAVQVWMPSVPQPWAEPGEHAPWPLQLTGSA